MNTQIIQDVDFPKFTSSLIQGVFETIQDNHLAQIKSYSELVKATAMNLSTFISNNYITVPNESVYAFLQNPISLKDTSTTSPKTFSTIDEWVQASTTPGTLIALSDYTQLNALLNVGSTSPAISSSSTIDQLMIAIRKKIASDNFSALQEMVKMGMQRVVTDKILIKTRLSFKATDFSLDAKNQTSSTYGTKAFNVSGNAYYRGKRFGASIGAGYSSVKTTVNTSNHSSQNSNIANLNLLGYVKIEAHTDYQPLSA